MNKSLLYFEDVAKDWDQIRTAYFTPQMRDAAILSAGLVHSEKARYADIGTGTGFVIEGLVNTGVQLIGFDESRSMLSTAREKFARNANVTFRLVEGSKLEAKDSSFDAVFANMYLHHTPNPQRAIREMCRILKSGGKLIITDLEAHEQEWMQNEMADRWLGFKRADVSRWFKANGLDISINRAKGTCNCTSPSQQDIQLDVFVAIGTKR